jgi:phosphoribosylformylglycinamidine (FGAM) synthase-like enzyme
VGAVPLAITDNLNFGNPEKPETMGEIVAAIEGIAAASRELSFPVVSGNCSLYNETNGEAILPTPAIGGVGLLKSVHRMASIAFKREGETIIRLGKPAGHLGQSLYLREIEGREEGAPPPVDLAAERNAGDFVRRLIESGRIDTVHDISDGGLLVAAAEMAMAGGIGAEIAPPEGPLIPVLFGEDQASYVLAAAPDEATRILEEATQAGLPARIIGRTRGSDLVVGGKRLKLAELGAAHEAWFPRFMGDAAVTAEKML